MQELRILLGERWWYSCLACSGICAGSRTARVRLFLSYRPTVFPPGHLRPSSSFYPKVNFSRVVAGIPDGSEVLMMFGEIDCREGILVAVAKGRYKVRPILCFGMRACIIDA